MAVIGNSQSNGGTGRSVYFPPVSAWEAVSGRYWRESRLEAGERRLVSGNAAKPHRSSKGLSDTTLSNSRSVKRGSRREPRSANAQLLLHGFVVCHKIAADPPFSTWKGMSANNSFKGLAFE